MRFAAGILLLLVPFIALGVITVLIDGFIEGIIVLLVVTGITVCVIGCFVGAIYLLTPGSRPSSTE